MKKITPLFMLLLCATTGRASHLDIGLHAGGGTTWMTNKNISDQGPELDPVASFAPLFGAHVQYGGRSTCLYVELNYAPVNQKYKGSTTFAGTTYNAKGKDKLGYFSIPILVQLRSSSGFYFEIGPQFSFLTGAKTDASVTPSSGSDYTGHDTKSNFKSTIISGAIGVGGKWKIADDLFLNAGLRLTYGFNDATKEYSQTEFANLPADKTSITSEYAHQDQQGNFSYKPTHIATGHVLVGLSYRVWRSKKPAARENAAPESK